VHYIAKMFWPVDLVAMYPLPREIPTAEVLGAVVILVGISALVARAGRRHPYWVVGWLWYIVALLPVIGIVQVGAQSSADRYTYVPLIGLFLMIAWGVPELLDAWPGRTFVLRFASAAVVTACTVLSFRQAQHWRNSLALWQHAVDATPDSYFAHASLGYVLWKSGKVDDAMTQYNESLRLRSDFAETHNNLGVALAQKGQLAAALPQFSEALRQKPGFTAARDNLSATTARLRALDGELARYADDVRNRPNDLVARNEFGAALAAQGRIDEAIEQFAAALQIDSTQADVHYNLGMMLERKGRTKEALAAFEATLRHNPKHEAARQAIAALMAGRANGKQR
jgi:tetratricopeptide (TPR) repeat protein